MELESDFTTFLNEIRPTLNQRSSLKRGHEKLREQLNSAAELSPILISDFLQGSYRRATAVRPKNDRNSDVDIIVVTKMSEKEFMPVSAMDKFKPFLERHYKGKWKQQGRSFGIELTDVDIDLVITSAPSESEIGVFKYAAIINDDDISEAIDWRIHKSWLPISARHREDARFMLAEAGREPEWKIHPLRIPDREANIWESTHPLEQIRWTRDKNANTNKHFVNVVKALKWWRLEKYEEPKHPKGFPLERIIGECCPDGIESVAEGVTKTLETIVSKYNVQAVIGSNPILPDYGVPTHDVFKRISTDDFKVFFEQVKKDAVLARRALNSNDRTTSGNLWNELFGSKFPLPPNNGGEKSGYSPPSEPANPGSARFATI